MRISRSFVGILVAGLCLCFALPAAAQYIGVLQSAETMDRGTFKLMVAPIMVFGKDGADDDVRRSRLAGGMDSPTASTPKPSWASSRTVRSSARMASCGS